MFLGRRTHAYTPTSIKRLPGVLVKTGLRLRRQPGLAPVGCFVASLLILVGALVQLAVELEAAAS